MTPYFEDGLVTIYHGDCADLVGDIGRFDLLCTDPPYGIGEAAGKNKSRGRLAKSKDYGSDEWDNEPVPINILESLCLTSTWQCIFGGNYYSLPASPCWLIWDKRCKDVSNDFADCELAWTNYGKASRIKRHMWNGYWQHDMSNKEERHHPTQKPLAVMSWAISLCPERPTSVFDPYMGSGTTLRACKDLGIKAVGIEREERYCEIAAKRMAQATLGL